MKVPGLLARSGPSECVASAGARRMLLAQTGGDAAVVCVGRPRREARLRALRSGRQRLPRRAGHAPCATHAPRMRFARRRHSAVRPLQRVRQLVRFHSAQCKSLPRRSRSGAPDCVCGHVADALSEVCRFVVSPLDAAHVLELCDADGADGASAPPFAAVVYTIFRCRSLCSRAGTW